MIDELGFLTSKHKPALDRIAVLKAEIKKKSKSNRIVGKKFIGMLSRSTRSILDGPRIKAAMSKEWIKKFTKQSETINISIIPK